MAMGGFPPRRDGAVRQSPRKRLCLFESRLGSQISKLQSGFELTAGLPTSSSLKKSSGEPR
jgi:hypothetical protein